MDTKNKKKNNKSLYLFNVFNKSVVLNICYTNKKYFIGVERVYENVFGSVPPLQTCQFHNLTLFIQWSNPFVWKGLNIVQCLFNLWLSSFLTPTIAFLNTVKVMWWIMECIPKTQWVFWINQIKNNVSVSFLATLVNEMMKLCRNLPLSWG